MSARPVAWGSPNETPEWTNCCWPDCLLLAEGGGPPLCRKHFRQVGVEWMAAEAGKFLSGRFPTAPADHVPLSEHLEKRDRAMAAQTQVYYVRIGDHVKIGYTINMRERMRSLRVSEDAVLATEPGGREVERERHKQFAAERVGRREDFNPSRRLLAHIEEVCAEHGPPKITTYKTARIA